jgi:hypothetical protein
VLGGDNERLHEEILTAGGIIREGRFSRLNVGTLREALQAADGSEGEPGEPLRTSLVGLWPSLEKPLRQALDARMRNRTENLGKFIAERAAKEAADIAALLNELRRNIEDEIHNPNARDRPLFSLLQAEELDRNRASLMARLDRIPAELEKETQRIGDRYRDPTPRLFPISVSFLVPEPLA